ncbi:MAG TPA: hypothetical protein VFU60_14810 [Ktedonobacterales bacterium]|jgi:hypothetical protein|nr:hypothetical protein [Ktedonobacterales bacterium]
MSSLPSNDPIRKQPDTTSGTNPIIALTRCALIAVLALTIGVLAAACADALAAPRHLSSTAKQLAASATTTHLTLDILPVRPGGPDDNWPAYMATSLTALPANTVVTVTIRNFDLGDDAVPANYPMLTVQGTIGGVAYVNGKSYSGLDATHMSHTFTISALHLNVPIPGDAVGDATNVPVTFSFRTPAKAGTYTFQCYVPCGTGSSGFDGPMATMGYMRGTITVA